MSTIVDINIDIQKQIWLWCYTKLPEQPEQSQGQNHTRRSWPGCCICHVLTAPDPNTSWEGTKKKKPVIAQCWIHRVLGSVTIIQRSSRNFMHEFLSCCLARILSAGWTQHCYAKCTKKTKWTKWTSWTTTACVSSCQHFCHPSHPTRQVLAHGAPTSLLISKRALRGTCKRGYGREMLGMLEVIKPNG